MFSNVYCPERILNYVGCYGGSVKSAVGQFL